MLSTLFSSQNQNTARHQLPGKKTNSVSAETRAMDFQDTLSQVCRLDGLGVGCKVQALDREILAWPPVSSSDWRDLQIKRGCKVWVRGEHPCSCAGKKHRGSPRQWKIFPQISFFVRGRGGTHTGPYLAFKRFLPRVLERMDLEGHAALEGLPAGLAGERHVLGVS